MYGPTLIGFWFFTELGRRPVMKFSNFLYSPNLNSGPLSRKTRPLAPAAGHRSHRRLPATAPAPAGCLRLYSEKGTREQATDEHFLLDKL
ncbi:hypothetical protein L6452_31310 [Arctium lappa]|uniref:Uncharacterized protein n=1 Tax=Arctium lappa TaxID=4217 RepID=A0ACB8ZKT7_ARCLA|nr:hypothetical protein L6452_31310 [Arctium lappa]